MGRVMMWLMCLVPGWRQKRMAKVTSEMQRVREELRAELQRTPPVQVSLVMVVGDVKRAVSPVKVEVNAFGPGVAEQWKPLGDLVADRVVCALCRRGIASGRRTRERVWSWIGSCWDCGARCAGWWGGLGRRW